MGSMINFMCSLDLHTQMNQINAVVCSSWPFLLLLFLRLGGWLCITGFWVGRGKPPCWYNKSTSLLVGAA